MIFIMRLRIIICIIFISSVGVLMAQEQEVDNEYEYALIEAVKQKNLGNIPDAIKLYKLVIKEKPDVSVAYFELGSIYMMTNQPELAEEYLEQAYEQDPTNYWYTGSYIEILVYNKKYKEAKGILNRLIRKEDNNVEYKFQLARLYVESGKEKKSLNMLDQIEKENGYSEKVTLLKASIYEDIGKFDLAKQEIDRVLALFPESLQFRIVAAELCLKSGKDDEAAEYYKQVFEIDSTNIFAITNLTDYYRKKEDYGNSFYYLKKSFENPQIDRKRKLAILTYYLSEENYVNNYMDDLDNLVTVYLKEYPDDPDGKLVAVDFYINKKDYEKAYFILNDYLGLKEAPYPVWMQAVLLANAASLNEELVDITNKALKNYGDSVDIVFFRAIGLYGLDRYNDVIETLDTLNFDQYSNEEYSKSSLNLLAESYYREGDYVKSDSIYEALIEQNSSDYIAMNNYSFYLAERGVNLERARLLSYATIRSNPENATFLDTYAWILFKMEDYDNSEKYIREALNKGGENDPEVNEHAGDIQNALGSYSLAKKYYEKALILGGDKERLKKKIEKYPDE